jgi:hypothetical protein
MSLIVFTALGSSLILIGWALIARLDLGLFTFNSTFTYFITGTCKAEVGRFSAEAFLQLHSLNILGGLFLLGVLGCCFSIDFCSGPGFLSLFYLLIS